MLMKLIFCRARFTYTFWFICVRITEQLSSKSFLYNHTHTYENGYEAD